MAAVANNDTLTLTPKEFNLLHDAMELIGTVRGQATNTSELHKQIELVQDNLLQMLMMANIKR